MKCYLKFMAHTIYKHPHTVKLGFGVHTQHMMFAHIYTIHMYTNHNEMQLLPA